MSVCVWGVGRDGGGGVGFATLGSFCNIYKGFISRILSQVFRQVKKKKNRKQITNC